MRISKPLTIQEFARMGGHARARKYGKRQLRAWGKLGGRPRKSKTGRNGKR
jgi:hypothetical protein